MLLIIKCIQYQIITYLVILGTRVLFSLHPVKNALFTPIPGILRTRYATAEGVFFTFTNAFWKVNQGQASSFYTHESYLVPYIVT